MADYDRRILVPYLRDVCCTEMLVRKLEQDISRCQTEANKYTRWANGTYNDPKRPEPRDYLGGDGSAAGGAVVGIIICLVGCMMLFIPFLGIPAIIFGLLMAWVGISDNKEAEKKQQKKYDDALSAYNKQVENNKRNRNKIPEWRATAQRWKHQEETTRRNLQDVKRQREKLYAVNIIPSRYRTIHAVYYLYDFFEHSRATDLEMTIQTMLLDEIVQRMDKLISQNQQILLNQRRQIALQDRQNQMIEDNHREEMNKIARMEANQERQLDYQRMIERNQEVTNFFLAADYIEKHR